MGKFKRTDLRDVVPRQDTELARQYKTQKKQIQKHKVPKHQFLLAASLVSFEILCFVNTNVTEAQS